MTEPGEIPNGERVSGEESDSVESEEETQPNTRNKQQKKQQNTQQRSNPIGGYLQIVRYFNGGQEDSVSFADFIQSLELASDFGGWNQQQKLAVFKSRLIGPALDFLNGCRDLKTITYDTLKEKFEEWYMPEQPLIDPLATFYQCKQRPTENARAFVSRLRAKGVAAAPDSLPRQNKKIRQGLVDEAIVTVFVQGLNKSSGGGQVNLHKPKTLDEALQLAIMCEGSARNATSRVTMIREQAWMKDNMATQAPQCSITSKDSQYANEPDQSHAESTVSSASNTVTELSKVCAIDTSQKTQGELAEIRAILATMAKQLAESAQQQSQPMRPQQNQQVSNRNSDYLNVICFRCNQSGHYATRCLAGAGLSCEYCNRKNHVVADCWFKQRDSNAGRGRSTSAPLVRSQQYQQRQPQKVSFAPKQGAQPQDFDRSSGTAGPRRTERN